MNSENKSQRVAVMVLSQMPLAHKLQNRKIASVAQGHVYLMENDDGITMKKTDS